MGHLRNQMYEISALISVSNLQKSEVQVTAAPDINCLLF